MELNKENPNNSLRSDKGALTLIYRGNNEEWVIATFPSIAAKELFWKLYERTSAQYCGEENCVNRNKD